MSLNKKMHYYRDSDYYLIDENDLQIKFVVVTLNPEDKMFVIYIVSILESKKIIVYL